MNKVYSIGYYSQETNGYLFYCFNDEQGSFLSKDINNAYRFMSIESALKDAPNLMKLFWTKPICYTILKGTKIK